MKKILFAAAALLVMTACGHKADTQGAEASADPQEEAVAPAAPMSEDAVVELSNDTVYRPTVAVAEPTVLDFNATWCGPCRDFKPVFHAAAEKFPNVKFVSVDVDNNPETAAAFDVQAIPTVVFITKDGKTTRYVGTNEIVPLEKFENIVNSIFN